MRSNGSLNSAQYSASVQKTKLASVSADALCDASFTIVASAVSAAAALHGAGANVGGSEIAHARAPLFVKFMNSRPIAERRDAASRTSVSVAFSSRWRTSGLLR